MVIKNVEFDIDELEEKVVEGLQKSNLGYDHQTINNIIHETLTQLAIKEANQRLDEEIIKIFTPLVEFTSQTEKFAFLENFKKANAHYMTSFGRVGLPKPEWVSVKEVK